MRQNTVKFKPSYYIRAKTDMSQKLFDLFLRTRKIAFNLVSPV